jgi:hypothetical protein
MNKVYVVTSGIYSDYSIERVFSTEQLAKDWIGFRTNHFDIETWDLDDSSEPNIAESICATFHLEKSGLRFIGLEYSNNPHTDYVDFFQYSRCIRVRAWFPMDYDKERCIKVVSDTVAMTQAKFFIPHTSNFRINRKTMEKLDQWEFLKPTPTKPCDGEHEWSEWNQWSHTKKVRFCKVCGVEEEAACEYVQQTSCEEGHDWSYWTAPSGVAPPYTVNRKCKICGVEELKEVK